MRTSRKITWLIPGFVVAVVGCMEDASSPLDSSPMFQTAAATATATVKGGGRAEIVDSPFPEAIGTVTNFAVAAKVYDDGTATGQFTCVIPGLLTVSGRVEQGTFLGGDPSQVYVKGTATFVDKFGGTPPLIIEDFFEITLTEGGPGEGGFIYVDAVTSGDTEVILQGKINISN